jgi:hypothetical protein
VDRCVIAPDPIGLSSVRGPPGSGFVATNFLSRGATREATQTNGACRAEWRALGRIGTPQSDCDHTGALIRRGAVLSRTTSSVGNT